MRQRRWLGIAVVLLGLLTILLQIGLLHGLTGWLPSSAEQAPTGKAADSLRGVPPEVHSRCLRAQPPVLPP